MFYPQTEGIDSASRDVRTKGERDFRHVLKIAQAAGKIGRVESEKFHNDSEKKHEKYKSTFARFKRKTEPR